MKVSLRPVFVSLTSALVILLCGGADSFAQSNYSAVKTIVLDAGHGGKDAGTTHGKIYEKDINLKVVLKLGKLIEDNLPDVKVVYTRKTDKEVGLAERGQIANKAGADLFISIHVDAVDKGKKAPSGSLALVMGQNHEARNLEVAMRENDVIVYEDDYQTKYAGYTPGSVESFIIFSLLQNVHLEQSMMLANLTQEHYKKGTNIPVLGARQQPLFVLKETAMPSVLIELGFLPNDHDRPILTSDDGQNKIAAALFNAVSEYKSRVENKASMVQLPAPGARGGAAAVVKDIPSGEGSVVYMIQVCSSQRKLGHNGSVLKPHKDRGITEKEIDGLFKYYVGSCSRYSEAAELQKQVRKETPDAFMVAFQGGTQISVAEAKKITD